MTAFLTGSQAYGKPRPDSDIDLCVLVDSADYLRLKALAGYDGDANREGSFPCRFGKLNLLVFKSEKAFDTWSEATDNLIRVAPVTREFAVTHIDAKLREAGIRHEANYSSYGAVIIESDGEVEDVGF